MPVPAQNAPGPAQPLAPQVFAPDGPWAWPAGNGIAVREGALLPMCCVKCGTRENLKPRDQRFSWTPPWVWALIVISPLIAAIVAAILTKRTSLRLPICQPCDSRWRSATLTSVFSLIGFLVGLIGGIALLVNDLPILGLLLFVGSLVQLIVLSVTVAKPRVLRTTKIDRGSITLTGVHSLAQQAILDASRALPPVAAPVDGSIAAR